MTIDGEDPTREPNDDFEVEAGPVAPAERKAMLLGRLDRDPTEAVEEDFIRDLAGLSLRDQAQVIAAVKAKGGPVGMVRPALNRELKRRAALEKQRARAGIVAGGTPDPRPLALVTPDEHSVNDVAVGALAANDRIYQRSHGLVRVIVDDSPLAAEPPKVDPLPEATLRELLSRSVRFATARTTDDGGTILVPEHPPVWCVKAVAARGSWPGVRFLTGVTECPLLRPDGTVLNRPGYDPTTGYLYMPNATYAEVPEHPTDEEIDAAHELLLEVVENFEFDTIGPLEKPEDNRFLYVGAWLASVLTLVARPAIKGPCPAFAIDAATPGTGKSLLLDVTCVLGTGRTAAPIGHKDDPVENSKELFGKLLSGSPVIAIDNLGGPFGNEIIDAMLTAWPHYSGRVLGSNETPLVAMQAVWFFTGNNIRLRRDTVRRVLPIRLRATMDEPSQRPASDFKHPNLVAWALEHRPQLVVAALTLLRAWWDRGREKRDAVGSWGRFESWADVVPPALVWLGYPDPAQSRDANKDDDETNAHLVNIMDGWLRIAAAAKATALSATAMLAALKNTARPDSKDLEPMREAVSVLMKRPIEKVTPDAMGKLLGRFKGTSRGGRAFVNRKGESSFLWILVDAKTGTPVAIEVPPPPEPDLAEGSAAPAVTDLEDF